MRNNIPEFSGNPEDLDRFVDMILTDMSLDNLTYYANNKFATESVVTESGYILPATPEGGVDGVAGVDTDFPMPIHIGQSWDKELAKRVGEVIGNERRGTVNADVPNTLIFSAMSDIRPNPLNGRYYEEYSEDAFQAGTMADATASGIKGDDDFYLKANVDTKHYIGYNSEWNRKTSSNYINVRSLYDYQLPAFTKAVKSGNVQGYMSAFGSTNGIPNCISPLTKDIADQYDYALFNFCDLQGDSDLLDTLGNGYDMTYAPSSEVAAALLIKASVYANNYDPTLITQEDYLNAVNKGLFGLTRSDLEAYVRPQIEIWVRSGYFNQSEYPYADLAADESPMTSSNDAHQETALKAAEDGIVLLKNENNLLPLSKDKAILVSGMLADSRVQTWYSTATPNNIENAGITPVAALENLLENESGRVNYVPWIAGDIIRIKSDSSGKYVRTNDDKTLSADAESQEAAAEFQLYDWGRLAYSFLNLSSDQFLSNDAERLTPENFIYYQQNGIPIPNVEMESKDISVLPRIWSYEDVDGHKCFRYGAVESEVWQQLVSGIDFYESYLEAGNYLSVNADDMKLYLGNSTEDGPDETSFFAVETISEAGALVEAYVSDNDYAVLFIGIDSHIYASEMTDRPNLMLGENQIKLVENVAAAFKGKTVVVVKADESLNLDRIQNNDDVGAIVYMAYAGQYDSYALAKTLFGDSVPSAKLTASWLKDKSKLPQLLDNSSIDPNFTVDMKVADPADYKMTYMYNDSENTLYGFGYGLSYATFEYENISVTMASDTVIAVNLTVSNTGSYIGREIVQVYAAQDSSGYGSYVPAKQLIAFEKTDEILGGESQEVTIAISTDVLKKWNVVTQEYFIEVGNYNIMVGSSSEQLAHTETIAVSGTELGTLEITESVNVWERVFASSGTLAEEISKRRTAFREGNYFAVVSRQAGDFVAIPQVDLRGISTLELSVASANAESTIEIYINGTNGELLATLTFAATGTRTYYLYDDESAPVTEMDYTTVSQALDTTLDETVDLYLKFSAADIRIDWIKGI